MLISCNLIKVVFICALVDNIYLYKLMFYINWFNFWRIDYFCGESFIFWWGNDFIIGNDKINKIIVDIINFYGVYFVVFYKFWDIIYIIWYFLWLNMIWKK